MSDNIRALAANLLARKKAGLESYVLFLGAGASFGSGCSSSLQIADDVLRSRDSLQFQTWQAEISEATSKDPKFGELLKRDTNEKKMSRFLEIWGMLDSESKYAILRKHLWDEKVPSIGYSALAELASKHYFKTILSTNLDNLMEKALRQAGLLSPEDFIVVVNGKDSPEEVADQLQSTRAPIRLVKLHGTLESPVSYAFTREELYSLEKRIRPLLGQIINQSLLIVGHSMQDRDINVLFEEEGKEVHYVNPWLPMLGSSIDSILKVRGLGSMIHGDEASFDNFFQSLVSYIQAEDAEANNTSSEFSIEGFLISIGYEGELKTPRSRYKNLQTLYVKPTEYTDILAKLETDHVLFIIGEPHMGKTYTALYVLWEYYQKGYDTIHIRHDQLVNLLHRHEGNLKDLLIELFKPVNQRARIVHFDDPFGETQERRTDVFASQLNTFLELAKSYEHLRVLISSRLNIFNEAVAESRTGTNLEELEKTLRVHTSYSRDVLLDILHRYVQFYRPVWARDQTIITELNEELPAMLPAPHNIEFFVRTSEMLTSAEAVLSHVEESKKMVSALAGWMRHMPAHEQLFLIWIEICSTAGILFPGTGAAEIDIEKAYKETLAYLFAEGHLPGIPTMPFPSARDKFETILLERTDDGALKLDFVHPSYHEAFWHAVGQRFPIAQWWQLINNNVGPMLKDLEKRVDLVQLKMIERYGTINRDLDQLLLLSAESDDADEQLIALGHMLQRPDEFACLPQFAQCLDSVTSSDKTSVKVGFLDLYENYFRELPSVMLTHGPRFLFDGDGKARSRTQKLLMDLPPDLHSMLNQQEMERWRVILKVLHGYYYNHDWASQVLYGNSATLANNFAALTPTEITVLLNIRLADHRDFPIRFAQNIWHKLADDKKALLNIEHFLDSNDQELQVAAKGFVAIRLNDFVHLENTNQFVANVISVFQKFRLPYDANISSVLETIPGDRWPQPSTFWGEFIRLVRLDGIVTNRVLECYDQMSVEYRQSYIDSLFLPDVVQALRDYVRKHKPHFPLVHEDALAALLRAPGYVQYETLFALLCRYAQLSPKNREIVLNLIQNAEDPWIGGAVGQTTRNGLDEKLGGEIESLAFQIATVSNKQVVGALVAEMSQNYLDLKIGLRSQYKAILFELLKDPHMVHHAEEWMDHQRESFKFYDENYWDDMKVRMRNIVGQ